MLRHILKLLGIEIAVAGIIKKGDKIMLTKRSKLVFEGEKWCLPGGHIKKWETGENAVKREIKEEIGLNVKKAKFLFYHDEFVKRLGLHAIVLVFELDIEGKGKSNWEVSEIGWFNKSEINKLDMAFTHKEILNNFWKTKK